MPAKVKTSQVNFAGGGDDKAVVMVMCNRQEWLVDLVREPGMLLPLRPDTLPQAPHPNLLTGHPSGLVAPHSTSPRCIASLTQGNVRRVDGVFHISSFGQGVLHPAP